MTLTKRPQEIGGAWRQLRKASFAVELAALITAAFIVSRRMPQIGHLAFVTAAVISLLPIANRCMAAVDSGVLLSLEAFITLAAVGMISIGAPQEAAVLIFLFATADWLTASPAGSSWPT
ncbi:MAG TPA: hypothetical protein VMU69_13380 [Bradyrhizobium sp.]|nr:hypothetical protein [Bradyrhizobium sp.]